jgi:ADP-ribosylglycohydrolase
MFGAIVGDIVGSAHEFSAPKTTDFELFVPGSRFTDDTVLTMATAKVLLHGPDYAEAYRDFGTRYPDRIYGVRFIRWLDDPEMGPYNSWGNGSAMRVSPVGFAAGSEAEALDGARRSAEVTHNHPEGIKGAQATALAVYLARNGAGKEELRRRIQERFGYDLDRTVDAVRPGYAFNESCQGTVPEAVLCVLDSRDFEHCLRLAVSLGGDADTLACIAGGIAHAHYGEVPATLRKQAEARLPGEFLDLIAEFEERFP